MRMDSFCKEWLLVKVQEETLNDTIVNNRPISCLLIRNFRASSPVYNPERKVVFTQYELNDLYFSVKLRCRVNGRESKRLDSELKAFLKAWPHAMTFEELLDKGVEFRMRYKPGDLAEVSEDHKYLTDFSVIKSTGQFLAQLTACKLLWQDLSNVVIKTESTTRLALAGYSIYEEFFKRRKKAK